MCPHNVGNSRSAPPAAAAAAAVVAAAAPPVLAPADYKLNEWSTGLCGCCEDSSSCFTTCFCPFITFGQTAEIVDRGTTSCVRAGLVYGLLALVCCPCLTMYTCTSRRKLRIMFGLKEEPCADYFVHSCCHLCAICQEYRELQNHGFDPSVAGWLANADRLNRGGASLTTCCCPFITFGQTAEIIDRGNTSCVRAGLVYCLLAVVGCPCLYTCTSRRKLRIMFELKEEPCADYLVHCCCHLCAICQEYRELQNRGFDPSIAGWLANADRLNRGGATPMAPPTMATPMGR
ncbi:hypothetical protein GQ457_15G001360 [Hibiscus cannabinus]